MTLMNVSVILASKRKNFWRNVNFSFGNIVSLSSWLFMGIIFILELALSLKISPKIP